MLMINVASTGGNVIRVHRRPGNPGVREFFLDPRICGVGEAIGWQGAGTDVGLVGALGVLGQRFSGCRRVFSVKHPAGLEMGRVKTTFSCDWQEVNHAFRSVFSCFYVVHEGQFYCDFEFSLGFTVYS